MKKGYSLIELITILAIFSTILLVGLSLMVGSKENMQRSQENSDMHYQARIASDFIRDEIRNATSFDLIATPTVFSDDGYNYLYVESGILKYVDAGIIYDKTSSIISTVPTFQLNLDASHQNTLDYTIEVTVSNNLGTRIYTVDTSVHLNNISRQASNNSTCIRYIKP